MHLWSLIGDETLLNAKELSLVGVLAAVIAAIMTKKLVIGSFYEDLRENNELLQKENEKLKETMMTLVTISQELASVNKQNEKLNQELDACHSRIQQLEHPPH